MDGEDLEEDALLQKLRDSRRRFQRRMQQLIEKYNQPFEDDPLVHMATLTYETPQGLRIWGGRLIKERNKGQIQDPPAKAVDGIDGPMQATAEGSERLPHRTQVPGADSESSSVEAALDQEEASARALTPTVPQSPLRAELRRKYLTQVDILLQDARYFEGADNGREKDTSVMPVPPLASPAVPAPGCCGHISAKPASSPREWDPLHPCQADMAITPRNDSISLLETSSNSCLSSQSFEADDICNVTISDLYAGMLHSMSRLLSTKPSCIISTKTSIVQNWNPRRRPPRKSRVRVNETSCQGGWYPWRSSKRRSAPCSRLGRETGVLRDCKNLLHGARCKTELKSEKAFLEENKPQIRKLDPSWKELQVTPQKRSSLTYADFSTALSLDQENRLMMLKWLISPVKIISRQRMLQGHAESRYREIEIKFDKLHQECCPYPGKQPRLAGPPDSWAIDVYRGGAVSPGSPRCLETHGPSSPFSRAKAKRLSEAFENLSKRSISTGRCPPESGSFASRSEGRGCPSHSQQTSDLFQGHNSGTFRQVVSPCKAISVPQIGPSGYGRNRYDEIKEKFDKLHQKCCQASPQQGKVPSRVRASPGKARAEVQCQTGDLGQLHLDSHFQSFQNSSTSSQWHIKNPQGSPAMEAHAPTRNACSATRDPQFQFPTKRRRLSEPLVCGSRADSWDSSGWVGEASPRPGGQASTSRPDWGKKNTSFRMEEKSDFC